MYIIGDSLKGLKVGDLIDGVAGLLQQGLVYDDAERLIAVTGGKHFAVLAKEVEVIGGHFLVEIGILQIEAVFAPGIQSALVTALEQCGSLALVHLGGQSGLIIAGGGGNDLYGYSGELGILLSQLLPGSVGLGLEVEVIDGACGSGLLGGLLRGRRSAFLGGLSLFRSGCGAGRHREYHGDGQQQCQELLHFCYPLFFISFSRGKNRANLIHILYRSAPAELCLQRQMPVFSPALYHVEKYLHAFLSHLMHWLA